MGKLHPGLDINSQLSPRAGSHIKGINWLTFMNKNIFSKISDSEIKKLPSTISIFNLPTGFAIKAGLQPEIGDTDNQLNCENYPVVGRVLAPVRDHAGPNGYPQLMMPESGLIGCWERTEEWLERFDT